MFKKLILTIIIGLATLPATAQKRIFIPEELRAIDFTCDTSRYCWMHSAQTRDLVFFWEKGFGDDLSTAPQLDGHPMQVDLDNLKQRVQGFYNFFRDTLKFTLPGSKADRYKMMVMINYSLEGTAYGGTYDNFIGALWVAPNRIQDRKLNCLAHELGHCFQLQIIADSVSPAWGGSGFYEMTSQWMLWLVNPDWLTDENYHFEAFKELTHKAFLDGSNIYHSPYVIEYWAEKHGLTSIADLYRNGREGEDPVMTYQRLYGVKQQAFNDEMIRCYQQLINLDFHHAYRETRRYACQWHTPMHAVGAGWSPDSTVVPEDYGFNAIRLKGATEGQTVTANLRAQGPEKGFRYAFVAVTQSGRAVYGRPVSRGKASLRLPREPLRAVYLVVMGAPAQHRMLSWESSEPNRQYPYTVTFNKGVKPESK